jgi:hypothetical protein
VGARVSGVPSASLLEIENSREAGRGKDDEETKHEAMKYAAGDIVTYIH